MKHDQTSKLTSASIIALANACKSLVTLNLQYASSRADARARARARDARVAARAAPYSRRTRSALTRARAAPLPSRPMRSTLARASPDPSLYRSLVRCCRQLTDPSILAIAHNCKSLETLNVEYASPRRRPPLPAFRISRASDPLVRGCSQLTDPSIIAIAENCKGLKELNVAYASPQRRPLFPRCESHARPTPLSSGAANS